MRMQYGLCYLVNFFKRKFNTIRCKKSSIFYCAIKINSYFCSVKIRECITNKNFKEMNATTKLTYNVVFNDDNSSNDKGFEQTLDYCKNYIATYNGTNESYFADYKGALYR